MFLRPQQNGIVERKHKQLLEIAQALLFQSNLPKPFWEDAILTVTYLINRLPSSVLEWRTPFEIIYGRKLDYNQLKTFGCLCFISNNLPPRDKLDTRSSKCIFLGGVCSTRKLIKSMTYNIVSSVFPKMLLFMKTHSHFIQFVMTKKRFLCLRLIFQLMPPFLILIPLPFMVLL